ncbi:MAG: galactitol-1-phosphate 5-dehydrogenase [Opitutae bacterium]|nr:galactitol-1-phosphate 5-dehydrogenase [Opitutae bacterium]|tara:strand:+ start:144 stop:1175 length:1032 start_codon:yes stop_codon:yes gene_type:complete
MKALTLEAYGKFTYGDSPDPEPGEGEVQIEVKACGICGSDVHGMDGSTGRRHPPIIMGHEAAGVISKLGTGVSGLNAGDRVTFDSTTYCGQCPYCQKGLVNLCENRQVIGVSCAEYRRHGAFAEKVVIPQLGICSIPDTVSFEQAALAEPVSIALHAVNRLPIQGGETAVVVGTGMIGLFLVQALKAAGCSRVFAVDLAKDKLALAKELGADETLVPNEDDVCAKVREATAGEGAHFSLEAVGASETVRLAIEVLRKGGSTCLVGNLAPVVDLPLQAVVTRELSVYGSCASAGEYTEALASVASGKIQVDPIISSVGDLKDGADWFARLADNREGLLKVVLRP